MKILLRTSAALPLLLSLATAAEDLTETVLVTADRIASPALDLPLAWSVVEEQALDLTAHVHINETMQRVSGAWISRGNGQESLTALRSPVLTGAGSCGSFMMAWDNISLRAPGFCNVNQLFDANTEQAGRIEVIKGPATALFGSNAMHGVINVLSAAPTETASHRLSLEAGPYDYYRAKYAYGNTRGRHGISFRINGTTDGGYKEDSGYDQQKLNLRHDYSGDIWSISSALQFANLNQETAGFIQGFEAYKDPDLKDSNPNPEAYRDARSLLAYSRASREFGLLSLSITPYLRHNDMEFLQHFLPWQPVEKNGHSSLGLRSELRGAIGQGNWVAGLDLDYTEGWLEEIQEEPFSPNQPEGVHYDYEVEALNAALFTQLDYPLGDRWQLEGGLRIEYTGYDYKNLTEDGSACGPEASACRFYRPADRRDHFNDWNANIGLSYALNSENRLFVRAANGFRAPQTTELYRLQAGQEVADLDSEEIGNIELGLRGTLAERFAYQINAFRMQKDNVIFQDADRQNVSGAETKHYGIEGRLDYTINDHWYLGLAATSARHKYDSNIRLLGSEGDIKGNDIDTAPRLFGSARLGRHIDFPSGTGVAELEWVYLDSYYLEPDNLHEYEGHSLLNLRLRAPFANRWEAALRITNLLDEDYAERADYGFGSYRYFVGQPLGAYVEVSYLVGG